MPRRPRVFVPGGIYHVASRGNGGGAIFTADEDRLLFLAHVGLVVERRGWLCHSYCLMTNHYHLLLETPQPNLGDGMRDLNGGYSQRFNRIHGRTGHLFRNRYRCVTVDSDSHLLELSRYIVRNPIRAGLCRRAEEWRWSSYRATTGLSPRPAFLTVDWILCLFEDDRHRARRAYERFVEGQAV